MRRILDLVAVSALALVVLMPKPSVEARPALEGAPVELDQVSKLQDEAFRNPRDLTPALALADACLSFFRADWAIQVLTPFVTMEERDEMPKDARVHLLLATARAERLEATFAVAERQKIDEACAAGEGTPGCPFGTVARARIIGSSMQVLMDKNIDPAKDPVRAKQEVYKMLHPSRTDFDPHRSAAPQKKAAPATAPAPTPAPPSPPVEKKQP